MVVVVFLVQENIECDFEPVTSSPAPLVQLIDAPPPTTVRPSHRFFAINVSVRIMVTVMPNTHRRRRCDETVLSRRRRRCEQNSQLAHDDCRRIRLTIWKLTKQTP